MRTQAPREALHLAKFGSCHGLFNRPSLLDTQKLASASAAAGDRMTQTQTSGKLLALASILAMMPWRSRGWGESLTIPGTRAALNSAKHTVCLFIPPETPFSDHDG